MKIGFQLLLLIALCVSCSDEPVFDESPAIRNAKRISELRKELVDAPHGWSVTYFPKTDSLLFTNVSEPIGQFEFRNKLGYGGHCFFMKFSDQGTVDIKADYDLDTQNQVQRSEFAITQNSFTQLSFTTYSYLHRLVNDRFEGASDFLYVGKDLEENLVFRTASYMEPAREYIVFTKIKDEDSWEQDMQKAYANSRFFQQMKNPQLVIRKAGRIYFLSDMQSRIVVDNRDKNSQKQKEEEYYKRYQLFLFAKDPYAPNGWPKEVVGLGSGYVGTPMGLTFRPGIRYSKQYTFFDFERVGNRFVCELVKVYNPYTKTIRWMSKHLVTGGEPTGVIAEIWDKTNQ